ncbi:ketoacyl-synthetase C-terminal extension domain-containing protein, partial [Salinispora sp. H7-4]|uniref:ketoacyl-synthetase C-terminal extension domain-containing protein n=1 Tax=Salinispora sp. H7-4 TaxID=2748321 RepID=UPI00272A0078
MHVDEPSPQVDWSAGEVRLLTEAQQWPVLDRPRRAGVSSFGISGTNAHVILEQAPPAGAPPAVAPPTDAPTVDALPADVPPTDAFLAGAPRADVPGSEVLPWVLSARTDEALRAQAGQVRAAVAAATADAGDLAYALAKGRAALERRAVVVGDATDLLTGADALVAGAPVPTPLHDGSGIVFVFPGQGSQWLGMAVEL